MSRQTEDQTLVPFTLALALEAMRLKLDGVSLDPQDTSYGQLLASHAPNVMSRMSVRISQLLTRLLRKPRYTRHCLFCGTSLPRRVQISSCVLEVMHYMHLLERLL